MIKSPGKLHDMSPVWYDPRKKGNTMAADNLGRLIKIGDVCGFSSRRGSQTKLEVVIIRDIQPGGIKGEKIVKEFVLGRGWVTKLVPTHKIIRPDNLIITGLTEKEAVELVSIRKGKYGQG